MKNIKALFSIWLEGSITYALDESIDWAALLIASLKIFPWLKPRLLIQVFTNCWSTKKGFECWNFFLWILEYISYYNLAFILRRRQSFSIYSLTLRLVNVLNGRFKTHYHCLTNIYHHNISDAHVFWEKTD